MKTIGTALLIITITNLMAQSKFILTNLYDKKWITTDYEIEGIKFPEENKIKGDYIIFYSNHTLISIDHGLIMKSKWKFDSTLNTITAYVKKSKEISLMKIISLTETEFVFETTTSEGMPLILHNKKEDTQ